MNQPRTVDRVVLIKYALNVLKDQPDGIRPRDFYARIEADIKFDEFDLETMKGSGLPRWRAALHFNSVAASKADLLIKSDGRWIITEEGKSAAKLPDEELKRLMRSRYQEWRWGNSKPVAISSSPSDPVSPADRIDLLVETKGDNSVLLEDTKEKARAEIDEYLDRLGGYEFQDIVAALLEGMGYSTNLVSAPGADGGTDILAYIDPIGAQTPHIRVQVKHRKQPASREDVAALRGIMRGDREIGLFVSSGGFTREAKREAGNGSVHIQLVDLDRFFELWLQHYSKIPEQKRAKLRLEPVYFLAPEIT